MRYRVGFVLYWLLFAALAVVGGASHGLVSPWLTRHPELIPYPWKGVIGTSFILAILVAAFYWILRPPAFRTARWRLALALAVAAGLVVASVLTSVTDMPGYYYVPQEFSMVTFLVLIITTAVTLTRPRGHAL